MKRRPKRSLALGLAAGVAILAWGFDQATKLFVERNMELGQQIEVLPPVLFWRYHLNPGAAFSMGTEYTWLFTLIMVAVLSFVIWHSRNLGGSWLWAIGLGGLAGGISGNLTDRLFRPPSLVDGEFISFGQGHVVDFIAVPQFAIFNIADSFIVCSMIGICAMLVFGLNIDGTRENDKSSVEQNPVEQNPVEEKSAEQNSAEKSSEKLAGDDEAETTS